MKDKSAFGLSAGTAATVVAFLMIGNQVAGKATRDALFLSNFDVTKLPLILGVAAFVSIAAVFGVTRLITRLGPRSFVPLAFGISACLLLAQWVFSVRFPRITAVTIYLHMAAFGSVLVSSFWSLINERFDPRSGKKAVSRIATGGTVGGLAGGLLAARVGAVLPTPAMLPILALMHFVCAAITLVVNRSAAGRRRRTRRQRSSSRDKRWIQLLSTQPYLRSLAGLVVLGTVSATMIDYVFKAQAAAVYTESTSLLRFFAYYYTAVGLFTVVVQGGFSRICLQRLGLAKTASTLPAASSLATLAALFFPHLWTITFARTSEAVVRNSLYRSSYELFYTPLPEAEKRATKSIIDVGFERLGDAVGAGLVRGLLFLGPAVAHPTLLTLAVALGGASLLITRGLHQAYTRELGRSLRNRAVELDLSVVQDNTTRSVVLSITGSDYDPDQSFVSLPPPDLASRSRAGSDVAVATRPDPVLLKLSGLRAGNRKVIEAILAQEEIEPVLVPDLIRLLANEHLARRTIRTLRRISRGITGQLVDALLQEQDFAIRRRVPRAISGSPTQLAADGLLLGLGDLRFEVRFQCGRALAYIAGENPELHISTKRVHSAILDEVGVKRAVWEGHRLLDEFAEEEGEVDLFAEELVKDRSNRGLLHVFTLLSLTLPAEPLKIAYRGLHTPDPGLRGTSLEYLESVLPSKIRQHLWPFLEQQPTSKTETRSRSEILEKLIESDQTIQLSLEELKKLREL